MVLTDLINVSAGFAHGRMEKLGFNVPEVMQISTIALTTAANQFGDYVLHFFNQDRFSYLLRNQIAEHVSSSYESNKGNRAGLLVSFGINFLEYTTGYALGRFLIP